LALLVKPDISRIDLGGFEPISMKELAETMSAEFGGLEIIYENSNQIPSRYIPDPKYLRLVHQPISLVEGIKRWRIWAESSQT
jgi:nucleoside-diphosphate-sugar epimerase